MPHTNAVGITGKTKINFFKKTYRGILVQKHTIREFSFSSPLDLNMIFGL